MKKEEWNGKRKICKRQENGTLKQNSLRLGVFGDLISRNFMDIFQHKEKYAKKEQLTYRFPHTPGRFCPPPRWF